MPNKLTAERIQRRLAHLATEAHSIVSDLVRESNSVDAISLLARDLEFATLIIEKVAKNLAELS